MAKRAISVRLEEETIDLADGVDGMNRTEVIEAGVRVIAAYGPDPFGRVAVRRLPGAGLAAPAGGVQRTEFFGRLRIPMFNGTGKPAAVKAK